jgi:fatty-acyl-CoA synthase
MQAASVGTPWLEHDWSTLTYGEALRKSAQRFPGRIALSGMGRSLTFSALDRAADELAHGLASLGVGRRDQVAIWMTNCPDWVVCWMACTRLGAVLVTVNTRFKLEETEYILKQSDAKVLIAMDRFWNIDFLGMIREMVPESASIPPGQWRSDRLPSLRSVVLWESVEAPGCSNLGQLRKVGAAALSEGRTLAPTAVDDPVIIVYTSGTTGHPKGAMHSHQVLRNAANIARVMHIEPSDVILGHMPLYHVAGAVTACSVMLLLGCTMVTMAQWQTDEALEIIERERVSIFGGIPTHFIDCLDSIRRQPRDVSCLKSAWIGGAPVTPDVALAVREELGLKGLLAVYGMTETTAATTFSRFEDPLEILCENKGKPIGDFEVAVFDPGTGRMVAPGEVGEVRVRGHIVMLGYYKNPEATAEVVKPDGWFRTGDLGVIDEAGYLKITGRLKEMFIVGGSNAYPAEIERLLQAVDEIKQAVVVGVPDRRLGEVGFAFVQLHEGHALAEAELIARCRSMMADYKVPRHVRFTDEFPRTTTGKIQRFKLQREARDLLANKT